MTVTGPDIHGTGSAPPARATRAGRGVRDRARGLLAPVRRPTGARGGLPTARRAAGGRSRGRCRVGRTGRHGTEGATAGDELAAAQVDVVLCHAVTYATSSQVLPVLQAAKAPAVLLALQPTASLPYRETGTGEWLANCAACCVPEIAGACTRAGISYDTVAGTIDDDERAWRKIAAWVRAAGVARALTRPDRLSRPHLSRHARHVHGLHCTYTRRSGRTSRCSRWTTWRPRRRCDRRGDPREDREIEATFDFADPSRTRSPGLSSRADGWAARVAVGLDKLATDFDLQALTYYYRGARGQRVRAARRGRDPGQLAADGAWHSVRRRGRPEDQHCPMN